MELSVRPRGTDAAKIIQVIETKALRGRGTEDDLCRQVVQYWSLDGELLAENDPDKDNFVTADLSENENEWEETTQQQIDIDALKARVEQLGKKAADLEKEVRSQPEASSIYLNGREIGKTVS